MSTSTNDNHHKTSSNSNNNNNTSDSESTEKPIVVATEVEENKKTKEVVSKSKKSKNFFQKAFSFGDEDLDTDNRSQTMMMIQNNNHHHNNHYGSSLTATTPPPPSSSTNHQNKLSSSSNNSISSSTSSSHNKPNNNNQKVLNRGISFGHTRPGLHGGGNIRWFHNLFPLRQLFVPRVPFPVWDDNWDGKKTQRIKLGQRPSKIVTRHILLIRHGQYNDKLKDDRQRVLTELGRKQAQKTGQRLAEILLRAFEATNNSDCPLKVFCSSSLTRAKQTADIIYEELKTTTTKYNTEHPDQPLAWDLIDRGDCDPLLMEGHPIHHIPGPTGFTGLHVDEIDRDFPRVEEAFQKYIGTSQWLEHNPNGSSNPTEQERNDNNNQKKKKGTTVDHDYEIIVAHANVIRFMLCRALQIPPECWLRFNLFHGSITYLVVNPNGHVNCRLMGDIGHMDQQDITIDNKQGFHWL